MQGRRAEKKGSTQPRRKSTAKDRKKEGRRKDMKIHIETKAARRKKRRKIRLLSTSNTIEQIASEQAVWQDAFAGDF